ncbi:MAG: 50S ribosomal protein L15 [Candidatus Nomurabacteria bacterium]|nr:50S ribosomal protein L15 [Candidatus Saccharibacteria bacterium]USN95472.1 MAG: 50S ribosomal protein L15 [Candidatus Nomurabacteria bacterium]
MKFNQLQTAKSKSITRVGRGISAGKGKTAGRGTKGQNSRTGGGVRPGFEGGQNPLAQRLPKLPGFKSKTPKAENVYTGQLDSLGANIDNFKLAQAGIVTNPYTRVKLILKGDVTKKTTIKVQSASKSAVKAVEKAGGKVEIIERQKRQKQEKTTK